MKPPIAITLAPDEIDLSKRYDVYCREGDQQVVYRNARFKGARTLFARREHEPFALYMEIEQADGGTIFVARLSVIKFCEHGATPNCEKLP